MLTLPAAFAAGGYLLSPFLMIVAASLTTLCVKQLVQTGMKYNIYCYSMIVEKVLGSKGRHMLDVMIFLTQFSFTINMAIFVTKSLKTTVN